jgi:amidophosphoribosyltransferase
MKCIKCKSQENFLDSDVVNYVTAIYEPFTAQEVSDKIRNVKLQKSKQRLKLFFKQ